MKKQCQSFRSRWMVFLWLLMLVVFAVPDASFALDIYVSVDGGDQADGSLENPYGALRDAVEAMTGDILVVVAGGEYPIDSAIHFNETDSGKNGHYVTYRAKAGETPLLTGGVKVTGWKPVSGISPPMSARICLSRLSTIRRSVGDTSPSTTFSLMQSC
jgi:hypothetical protein